MIMRPCHGIRDSVQKKPTYRVRVRLIRIIKAADHGGKKNAKPELMIPFPWEAHNHKLCASQLALELQGVFHHSFVRAEARTPLGNTIVAKNAFLGRHEGINCSGDFNDGAHISEGS